MVKLLPQERHEKTLRPEQAIDRARLRAKWYKAIDETRQGRTNNQHEAKQDKARQAKTRQDKTRQGITSQGKTSQNKTRQDKTSQDKPRQEKSSQAKPNLKAERRHDKTRRD